MTDYIDDFYDYIMEKAEVEQLMLDYRQQAQENWELEQD